MTLAAGLSMLASCGGTEEYKPAVPKPVDPPTPFDPGNNDPPATVDEFPAKPNIILILADDLGYSDIGCYGSEINTPNLDGLAASGIRFRNFHNMARSSPTRACIMTGLYPHMVGQGALSTVEGAGENYQGWPNEKNNFIPECLKSAGYTSFLTGKWHLNQAHCKPLNRGFDHSFFFGGGWYWSDDVDNQENAALFYEDKSINKMTNANLPQQGVWYTSDQFVSMGLRWAQEALDKGKPFFWYMPFNAVHFPIQAHAETIAKYRGRYTEGYEVIRNRRWAKQKEMGLFDEGTPLPPPNPKNPKPWSKMNASEKDIADHRMAIYAACVEEMDRNIGRIVSFLDEKGIRDNTLIIFLSDNGGNAESGYPGRWKGDNPGLQGSDVWLGAAWADVANTPFFLYKHHGHQGGCCTPLILNWPAGIDESLRGTIDRENYGHLIDFMPTFIELAGGSYPSVHAGNAVPPMEGVSITAAMKGKKIARTNPIIVEHEGNKMLRDGDWKIVQEYEGYNKTDEQNPWRLYNLRDDPTEMKDLAPSNPAKVQQMVSTYKQWADHIGVNYSITSFSLMEAWYTPVRDWVK